MKQSLCARHYGTEQCGTHNSGCGVAHLRDATISRERRGPDEVWNDSFQEHIRDIYSTSIIAHNRLASAGLKVHIDGCHPFIGSSSSGPVAFCHNGGVRTFFDQAKAQGLSDSQIFLEQILATVSELNTQTLSEAITAFSATWEYTSMTALLLTTHGIFGWRLYQTRGLPQEKIEASENYYTLWMNRTEGDSEQSVTVASEPLDTTRTWMKIPNRTFFHLHEGQCIATLNL
jgi:predicted glutamine amidotransferase